MIKNVQKGSILYVDDEVHNLNSFKATFRKDFEIFTAQSAREGIQVLKEHEIHVIITDQRMPEITGVEFLKSIITEHPDPVRIILTGYADIDAVINAINIGRVFRYVQKPWVEQELREIIFAAFEQYILVKANKENTKDLEETNKQMEFLLRQALLS